MSRKVSLFVSAIFILTALAFSVFSPGVQAQIPANRTTGKASLTIQVVDESEAALLGQANESAKKPGFFDRVKRSLANWAKDDDFDDEPISPQGSNRPISQPSHQVSVPTTPPKPPTAAEVRESTQTNAPLVEQREQPRERSTTLERRMAETERENRSTGTVSPAPARHTTPSMVRQNTEPVEVAQEESIHDRMRRLREQIFDDVADERPAAPVDREFRPTNLRAPTPQHRTPALPQEVVVETPTRTPANDIQPQADRVWPTPVEAEPKIARVPERTPLLRTPDSTPSYWNTISEPAEPVEKETRKDFQAGTNNPELPPLAGIAVPSGAPWNQAEPAFTRKTQPLRGDNPTGNGPKPTRLETENMVMDKAVKDKPVESRLQPGVLHGTKQTGAASVSLDATHKEKALLISPLIEVETEGSSRVVVGQESTYRVRVRNRGGAAAEQVTLTVEVPNWIEILPPDVSTGTTSIVPKGEKQESRDFVWKISRVDAMAEEQLVLHLVPQERKTVDLRIRYDFYRPSAIQTMVVQEPVLEMDLQGPDEVLWGTKVGYKLLVRNTGNGDAEKVKLELLQTGSDMKSCDLSVLKAGEEQIIDVDVWTGKQEHIDINILATGAYDLTEKVFKRVVVLRPKVTVQVESAEMQFVDSPAEFSITVQNEGTAPASNVELTAAIPLGARYVSNTGGGQATPQNQVVWSIPAIPVGEKFSATVVCEPKREGVCKLDASISDKNGLIASCSGAFNAEAIADLKMQVENPTGPIEVGQEAVFTINVSNRGTKTAEDVEVIAAFARGLDPFAIEGGNGTMNDGQVVFDKIPSISAGQTVTLKVKGKADKPGNHRMRTEVICPGVNTHLIFEQATYFYQKSKGKNSSVVKDDTTRPETVPPTPLGTLRGNSEPLPLRQTPTTAVKPEESFLR